MAGNGRGNMYDPAGVAIRRTWGDVEVVDATKELRVFIAPEDLEGATPKDPAYCVFARACRRAFHSTKVLFFRKVAYVELPGRDGVRRVERFIMGDGMRDLIASFDRGDGVIPEAGFVLRPPTAAKSLNSELRRSTAKRLAERRKLEGRAEAVDGSNRGKGKFRDAPVLVDLSVRNGMGAVKFKLGIGGGDGGMR